MALGFRAQGSMSLCDPLPSRSFGIDQLPLIVGNVRSLIIHEDMLVLALAWHQGGLL